MREYKVGKAYFSEKVVNWQFRKNELARDRWWIRTQTNQNSVCININIFPKMIRATLIQLQMNSIPMSNALTHIIHVQFPFLQCLSISANHIETIQLLAVLQCSTLKTIDAGSNDLCNVRSLRKLPAVKMKNIYLHRNPICQLNSLRELHTNHHAFDYICLQHLHRKDIIVWNALTVSAGWPIKSIKGITINMRKRVKQGRPWNMLESKCNKQLFEGRFFIEQRYI